MSASVKEKIEEEHCSYIHRFITRSDRDEYYTRFPMISNHPIVKGEYNGTKEDFEGLIYNLTNSKPLHEYGLLQIRFILKYVIDAFKAERLCMIDEFHLAHCGTNLIMMKNQGHKKTDEVLRFDLGEYFLTLQKESRLGKFLHSPEMDSRRQVDREETEATLRFVSDCESDDASQQQTSKWLFYAGLIVSGAAILLSASDIYFARPADRADVVMRSSAYMKTY